MNHLAQRSLKIQILLIWEQFSFFVMWLIERSYLWYKYTDTCFHACLYHVWFSLYYMHNLIFCRNIRARASVHACTMTDFYSTPSNPLSLVLYFKHALLFGRYIWAHAYVSTHTLNRRGTHQTRHRYECSRERTEGDQLCWCLTVYFEMSHG